MTDATGTLTLTDFLLARIAEDERIAQTASGVLSGPAQWGQSLWNFGDQRLEITKTRVLAECEAKRRIVAEHRADEDYLDWSCCSTCTAWDQQEPYEPPPTITWPCATLRALAIPYADHPDFQEAWRP